MKVPMPQAVDVLGLVAAHLALVEPRRGRQRAVGLPRGARAALVQAMRSQEPKDRRVGRHGPKLAPGLGQGDQIVVMELGTPALMGGILGEQRLAQGLVIAVGSPAS